MKVEFRAWHTVLKKMFYNVTAYSNGAWSTEDTHRGGVHGTLMQFTGLRDKSRKKIYEGDILNCGNGEYGEVAWHNEFSRFGLNFFSKFGGEGYTGTFQNIHEYAKIGKIIGNIYENPKFFK
jgi:hypothetical protein